MMRGKCQQCGDRFESAQTNQLYCVAACRTAAENQRRREARARMEQTPKPRLKPGPKHGSGPKVLAEDTPWLSPTPLEIKRLRQGAIPLPPHTNYGD